MRGRRRTITVTDRGATIVLKGYRVAELARHSGLRPVFNGVAQGWVTDAHRLPDLLAFCDSRNITVTVTSGAGGTDVPAVPETPQCDHSATHADLDLFGGELR